MDYNSLLLFPIVEKPTSIVDVDSGALLLVVPDPFGLELSDAPGKPLCGSILHTQIHFYMLFFPLLSTYKKNMMIVLIYP